jgi:hypothetical protein
VAQANAGQSGKTYRRQNILPAAALRPTALKKTPLPHSQFAIQRENLRRRLAIRSILLLGTYLSQTYQGQSEELPSRGHTFEAVL